MLLTDYGYSITTPSFWTPEEFRERFECGVASNREHQNNVSSIYQSLTYQMETVLAKLLNFLRGSSDYHILDCNLFLSEVEELPANNPPTLKVKDLDIVLGCATSQRPRRILEVKTSMTSSNSRARRQLEEVTSRCCKVRGMIIWIDMKHVFSKFIGGAPRGTKQSRQELIRTLREILNPNYSFQAIPAYHLDSAAVISLAQEYGFLPKWSNKELRAYYDDYLNLTKLSRT